MQGPPMDYLHTSSANIFGRESSQIVGQQTINMSSGPRAESPSAMAPTPISNRPWLPHSNPMNPPLSEISPPGAMQWNSYQQNTLQGEQQMHDFKHPESQKKMPGDVNHDFSFWMSSGVSMPQEPGNLNCSNPDPSLAYSVNSTFANNGTSFDVSQDLIHQPSNAQDHYYERSLCDSEKAPETTEMCLGGVAKSIQGQDKLASFLVLEKENYCPLSSFYLNYL